MGEVTRAGTEVLQLHNCPCCGGDVDVVECGYSAFNPGSAYCRGKCGRKWNLSYVDDAWDAGQKWNDRAHEIAMKLAALELLEIHSARYGDIYLGCGWWRGSAILWDWYDAYYDGRHFSCRLGPFTFNRSHF